MPEALIQGILRIFPWLNNSSVFTRITHFFLVLAMSFMYGVFKAADASMRNAFFIALVFLIIIYIVIFLFGVIKYPDIFRSEQHRLIDEISNTILQDKSVKKATIRCSKDTTTLTISRGDQNKKNQKVR